MALTYLLDDTPLFGGVKVVLRQADLMARQGHRVTVVSQGPRPDWYDLAAGFQRLPQLDPARLPEADVTVASYWTTIPVAAAVPRGQALHYCQGFEASYTHNRADHPAILAAYARPLPAMVVSPHLAELLARRFGRPARVVPQPLERFWRARWRRRPGRPPRILVVSPFEIDWKGVATALEAVRQLKASGLPCRLVRLSQWPLTSEERAVLEPDEFHHHLAPAAVARLVRGCDLLLAPSWEQEGFGLPALEAMASGVPAVVSDIPCYRAYAAGAATLVPAGDAAAFAAAAREILGDPARWRSLRRAGRAVARRFTEASSAAAAEQALRWAASGVWRREIRDQISMRV